MDFESFYAFLLIGAGIWSLLAAFRGESIEASENPRLSQRTSRIIYLLTGIVLIFFGILRLK